MKNLLLQCDLVRMRQLEKADIATIAQLASDQEIVNNTFVPHPYSEEAAREFIEQARQWWRNDEAYTFAIIEAASGQLAGCMGIHPVREHGRAEVGYWIGKPYRRRGFASAALRLLLEFGFEQLRLNRIEAGHFPYNPASGAVIEGANMRFEGRRRGYVRHREQYKDLIWYAITRADYDADRAEGSGAKNEETAED